jgi:hypothetical protein
MNRKVAPNRSSQLEGSAGKMVRMKAHARLTVRPKDIDGAIMVLPGGLMPLILRRHLDATTETTCL